MPTDRHQLWRSQMREVPIHGCGRLDMTTYMPDETTLGRVTSDRVRYVYFDDDSECIVLGKFCDHVAFRAADYNVRVAQLEARVEALIKERDEAEQVALELPPMADFEDYVPEDWFKRQAALSERRATRIDAALGEGGSDA